MLRASSLRLSLSALIGTLATWTLCAFLAPGCGSSPPNAQCNTDPWQCGTGQTCWVAACGPDINTCVPQFACLGSSPTKQVGESCTFNVGVVTCGDRQTCVRDVDASSGTCSLYCEPGNADRACPSGYQCTLETIGGASNPPPIHVCLPAPIDGGPDFDAGIPPPMEAGGFDGPAPGNDAS
jgi:hypothetical protein